MLGGGTSRPSSFLYRGEAKDLLKRTALSKLVMLVLPVLAACAPTDEGSPVAPTPESSAAAAAAKRGATPNHDAATAAGVNLRSPVYDIGDSVTIDIQPYLQQALPSVQVDGKVGRQWGTGTAILAALGAQGRLPPTVVVDLGTNGTVTADQFDSMMGVLGPQRHVVFVTVKVPRVWEDGDNGVLLEGVARYPNAVLADWHSLSQGHLEWFYRDGYHLTPWGSQLLAALIAAYVSIV